MNFQEQRRLSALERDMVILRGKVEELQEALERLSSVDVGVGNTAIRRPASTGGRPILRKPGA